MPKNQSIGQIAQWPAIPAGRHSSATC